jgi:hypothetical protein
LPHKNASAAHQLDGEGTWENSVSCVEPDSRSNAL